MVMTGTAVAKKETNKCKKFHDVGLIRDHQRPKKSHKKVYSKGKKWEQDQHWSNLSQILVLEQSRLQCEKSYQCT